MNQDYDLLHFCDKDFSLRKGPYEQENGVYRKPQGFWVTLPDGYNWQSWCKDEDFRLSSLKVIKHFRFSKDANILVINTEEDFLEFEGKYLIEQEGWVLSEGRSIIDWVRVTQEYDGILITNYFWEFRFHSWYYPWDCVSGCVWNLNVLLEGKTELNEEMGNV